MLYSTKNEWIFWGGKKFYLKQKKKTFLAATNQQNLKYLRLVDIPGEGIAST